jgi:FkbM family methyltransferase
MRKIHASEFVPPIVHRIAGFLNRKVLKPQFKRSPFNYVPDNVDARWILDVGANVGDVAEAALLSYPNAKVICFEPVSDTFQMLQSRLQPHPGRAYFYKSALSDRAGTEEINITSFHGANSLEPQAKLHQDLNPHVRELRKEKIDLVRLDDVAGSFPVDKIDILKIDVEGHEVPVLKGGRNFIANNVDVVIIEISLMRDASFENQALFEIFDFMHSTGFRLINVLDVHRSTGDSAMLAQMDCVFRHKRSLLGA